MEIVVKEFGKMVLWMERVTDRYIYIFITIGTCFYANGNRYEGDLKDGVMNGKGKSYYIIIKGMYSFSDGSKYEGEYKDGKRCGIGYL